MWIGDYCVVVRLSGWGWSFRRGCAFDGLLSFARIRLGPLRVFVGRLRETTA